MSTMVISNLSDDVMKTKKHCIPKKKIYIIWDQFDEKKASYEWKCRLFFKNYLLLLYIPIFENTI